MKIMKIPVSEILKAAHLAPTIMPCIMSKALTSHFSTETIDLYLLLPRD